MKLLTKEILAKLAKNLTIPMDERKPVVKFFGGPACTWLISEYDEKDGYFFGLCDLGLGFPEIGPVSKDELFSVTFPPLYLPVERDKGWKPKMTLIEYADKARKEGRIQ